MSREADVYLIRYLLLMGLIFSKLTFATTFQKVSLAKMIEEADSAAEVVLKDKKSFMTKMGVIQTEYTFKVNENFNINTFDLDGEDLKFILIGGTYGGVTSFIDGAPEFQVGEKAFVLLKKIEAKIYLSNFTLGKFKVINREGETFYSSVVFPDDPELGNIKKEVMIDLMKQKFKTTFANPIDNPKDKNKDKIVERGSVPKKDELRKPAQDSGVTEGSEAEAAKGQNAMWFFFFLMFGAASFIWWQLRKGVRH